MTAGHPDLPAPAALVPLLAAVIDYAGVFPPAALTLAEAVRTYAAHRRGPAAWMLGRFVVPAAHLDDLPAVAHAALADEPGSAGWRLSVTGRTFAEAMELVDAFTARPPGLAGRGGLTVDLVESPFDPSVLGWGERGSRVRPVVEVAVDGVDEDLLAAIARVGGVVKVRTGGLVPHAIPPVPALASLIARCAVVRVPLKATAGLHHPIRGEQALTYDPGAPRAAVHGFVNVLMAASLAWVGATAGDCPERIASRLAPVLAETDPAAFAFDDRAGRWRDVTLSAGELEQARSAFFLAFGSCSFDEPVAGLQALGWLRSGARGEGDDHRAR